MSLLVADPRGATGKVIVLGRASVGKTALVWRFIHDSFNASTQSTIGAAFALKQHNGIKLGIWDTAGQEKYDSLSTIYCRNAHVALLCYDVTDSQSFYRLPKYLSKLRSTEPDAAVVVVGCKDDLVNDMRPLGVPTVTSENYAKDIEARHYSTSALSGHNISDLLDHVAERVQECTALAARQDSLRFANMSKDDTVRLGGGSSSQQSKKGCCS